MNALLLLTVLLGATWPAANADQPSTAWPVSHVRMEQSTFDPFGASYKPPFDLEAFVDLASPTESTPVDVLAQCPNGQCPLPRTIYVPQSPTVVIPDYSAPKSPAIEPLNLRQALTLWAETATIAELNAVHESAHNGPAMMEGPPGWEREHVLDHIRDANSTALKRMANVAGLVHGETAYDDRRYQQQPTATQATQATGIGGRCGPFCRIRERQPVRSFFGRVRARFGRGY